MGAAGVGDRNKHPALDDNRDPLLRGSLGHAGLAHYYARKACESAGEPAEIFASPDAAIDACAVELGPAALPFVDIAKGAIRAYGAYWSRERLEILHVEEVFESFLGAERRRFTQRYDLVVREPTGKIVVYDHKFVSHISARVVDRYTLSGQFLGMLTTGRSLWGDEFGGVRVNLIEISGGVENKRTHGVSPVEYAFRRVAPDPAPAALRGFPLAVLHARQMIDDLDSSGVPPLEWPMALSEMVCITPYGRCDAFELCKWGP